MVKSLSSGKSRSTRPGEPFVFATGSALVLLIAMVFGVILLLALNGLGIFWPRELVLVDAKDGAAILGQEWRNEPIPRSSAEVLADAEDRTRTLYRVGNRREFGSEFTWVDDDQVVSTSAPAEAVMLERLEWGIAIGFLDGARQGDAPVDVAGDAGFLRFQELIEEARSERLGENLAPPLEDARTVGVLRLTDGATIEIPLAGVVRAWRPNDMGIAAKTGFYFARIWEFLSDDPRESNTAGGIFPAIMGTILLVLIMTLAVVPLGVVGALYLNEYARQGPLVRLVRLAVSNLAGVPSIVFGMFGLAFFVYVVGKRIDQTLDTSGGAVFGTSGLLWAALTLALLTVPVVIVATEESLRAVPRAQREGSLALGATKWQALRTVVLPASLPGILTGMILAIARGAGEVAPLMLVGAAKLAVHPLVDGEFPFLHAERKFMHLGFHIYDVGFQSPNVEASRPMVYATALVLLVLVVVLNLCAILFRNRVRRRLAGSTF